MMAKRRRSRGIQGAGMITQLPSGRWRLRVSMKGRQATYGTYLTEDLAADARARWRLTHLLPADDPEQAVALPASVAVGRVRCDKGFVRWQEAKKARRSRVRVNNKRGGAESTVATAHTSMSRTARCVPQRPVLGHLILRGVSQSDNVPGFLCHAGGGSGAT